MANPQIDETYSEEATKERAEAPLRKMLATLHKPHKERVKSDKGKM
jgi:hypothetical protein